MEPKIRLKGFNGDWNTTTLGAIGREYFVSNKTIHHQNLLSLSYGKIVEKNIKSKKGLLPSSFDTYQVIKDDIIVFRVTDLQNDKNSLRVAISKKEGIISPAYVSYECITKDILPDYLYLLLHCLDLRKVYYSMGDGMRQTLKYSDLKELQIEYPSEEEQKKIVDCLSFLDNLIQSTSKQLDKLRNIKTASLQSMFPQEGETKPRVRFKGFDGEWEITSLGSLFAERCEYDVTAEMLSVSQSQGIIKASDNGRFDNSNNDKSKYKLVRINDIAYNSMRMWQGACGCSPYEGIVSPAYTVVTPKDKVYSKFFYYMFKTNQMLNTFRLNSQGLTSDTWNLKYPAFSKLKTYYPASIDEQQKIADYFTNLDSQITLQTQRLEKLKRIKSACLDNMFV
ncbi:MAG: restriction endonuclease subunit S [Bacteroidaceae bacterium]|nr:restriction endonuclease subunit S [Bacteroidaceae bacterium]